MVTIRPVASTKKEKRPNSKLGHLVSLTVRMVVCQSVPTPLKRVFITQLTFVYFRPGEKGNHLHPVRLYVDEVSLSVHYKSLSQFLGDDVEIDEL